MPTIVSAHLTITGDLSGEADIQIEGKIEGNLRCRAVTIGPEGTVNGSIIAQEVYISGSFEGEISSKDVSLSSSARVKGDISVENSLSIETGAQFEGKSKRVASLEKLHQGKFEGQGKAQSANGAPKQNHDSARAAVS